jgi:hypothetical protein
MTATTTEHALRPCMICGKMIPVIRTLCGRKSCSRQWAREMASDVLFDNYASPTDTDKLFGPGR